MTPIEQLGQSGLLTMLGMGIVFSFLVILILVMNLTAFIVRKTGMDKKDSTNAPAAAAPAAGNQQAVVAAIAAAVHDKQLNS